MTEQEILESNKLIAEFLGWEYNNGKVRGWYNPKDSSHWENLKTEHLHFHDIWEALMLVVDKIESLGSIDVIISSNCIITWDDGVAYYNQVKKGSGTKIQAAHKCIVEFIKWYNENN